MKIRWSIVFLALFGIVAALGAAVLTATLSASRIQAAIPNKDEAEKKVDILVAARDLPAMTTVQEEHIVTKTVLESQLPEDYYSEPAQIVGKVLTLRVIEGQAYHKEAFPSEGHGSLLAAHLPKGKRAVTIALSDYSGLEGLLYPGCVVDVVASFRVESNRKVGKAVSTTLLQNIEVLGVEGNTVVDKSNDDSAKSRGSRSGMRRTLLVTLMVDSRQAEALQLAMEHGSISLAMRNPNDAEVAKSDATLLNDGNLAQLAALLAPKTTDGSESAEVLAPSVADETGAPAATEDEHAAGPATSVAKADVAVQPVRSGKQRSKGPKLWKVDVIRGLTSETRSFPVQN